MPTGPLHGGVPLGSFGRPLALSTVMTEVWAFMIQTGFTETVLVSIDNDDPADRGSDGGGGASRSTGPWCSPTAGRR